MNGITALGNVVRSVGQPVRSVADVTRNSALGMEVAFRETRPANPTHVFVLRGGMGTKPEYMDDLAQRLADHGVATYAMESEPKLLAHADDHARQIDAVVREAKLRNPGAEVRVGGECFGGAAALRWNSLFNRDGTPVVVLPLSMFTRFDVVHPDEVLKIMGSLVSPKLARQTIPGAVERGVPVTSNPSSKLFLDPRTGKPAEPVAQHPLGNYRDATLLPLKALISRWFARFSRQDVAPGPVKFLVAEHDKDIFNGVSKSVAKLYPNSTTDVIRGAEHSLTQELNHGIVDALHGWMTSAPRTQASRA